jgi:hypothetical protein
MRSAAIIVLSIIVFVSCRHPQNRKNVIIPIRLVDSIILDTPTRGFISLIESGGKMYWLFAASTTNTIGIYGTSDADRGKRLSTIGLGDSCGCSDKIFYNADSIFLYCTNKDKLVMMNINGVIKKVWQVDTFYKGAYLYLYGARSTVGFSFYSQQTNTWYARAEPSIEVALASKQQFLSSPHFIALGLEGDMAMVKYPFGAYPPAYASHQYYGSSISSRDFTLFMERALVSFHLSDSIYAYTADRPDEIKAYNARSNYAEIASDTFDLLKEPLHEYIDEFACNHFLYDFLISSTYSDYLFRIAKHKFHYYNADSTVNKSGYGPWSIIVLDKDLKLKGEIPIPGNTLDKLNIAIIGKGFWIASMKNYQKFYHYEMDFE